VGRGGADLSISMFVVIQSFLFNLKRKITLVQDYGTDKVMAFSTPFFLRRFCLYEYNRASFGIFSMLIKGYF
jgi:hypothetical protein